MVRTLVPIAFLSTVIFSPAFAQDARKAKPEVLPRVSALWSDMAQPMSVEPFVDKMTLGEALTLLQKRFHERHGRELPILINAQPFKDENPEAGDLNESVVMLQPHPRVRTTGQILRGLVAQIPTGNATYVVKPGVVEITTSNAAHPSNLLRQTVDLKYTRQPLSFVLEDIYEQTGVHVILDPRVGVNVRAPVTITFTHDMALGTGLVLIAEMTHCKLLETDNAVFITTPTAARQFWLERGAGPYVPPTYSSHRKEIVALPLPIPAVAGQ